MRTVELIKLLPTQYKRVSSFSALYTGHHMPLLGTWSKETGFVKEQSLRDDEVGASLACPIVAVITNKFGNKDVTLTITGKISTFKVDRTRTRGDYTITEKIYEPTETTITSTLKIPRYMRPFGTFLVAGLGRAIYEITSVTDDVEFDTGNVEFYALASAGSKIIYWLGIHQLAEQLREILRVHIAPPYCNRCSGTGIEPNTTATTCKQCLGYKYDGYSSTGYVQRKLGIDVGIARKILDWDNMTDEDHDVVKKFINKCWTQKWWVTPTRSEIIRLIKHFYMIEEDDFEIVERFHGQEPVWSLFLPLNPNTPAPFGQNDEDDRKLMKYIAESVTPAGVSVFVAFFEYIEQSLGDLDLFDEGIIFPPRPITSWEPVNSLWGTARWDLWNGWQEAIHDFEDGTGNSLECSGNVSCSGAYRLNANDMFRHVCQLDGSGSYYQIDFGSGHFSGAVEWWTHPSSSILRGVLLNEGMGEVVEVDFVPPLNAFQSDSKNIDMKCPDSESHIKIDFEGEYCTSYKDWLFKTDFRRSFTVDDSGTTLHSILITVDMSGWSNKPTATDWTNYTRLTRETGGVETEINSQCIDQSWNGGNNDALVFLIEDSSVNYTYRIYYGEDDLGNPGYVSDLTVTFDNPAAGDYTIQQDDFYKGILDRSDTAARKYVFSDFYTRVSGVDVRISDGITLLWFTQFTMIQPPNPWYYTMLDDAATLNLVEGSVGANAGAVLVAFEVNRVFRNVQGIAGNSLQDDLGEDITVKTVYIFCNCNLIDVIATITLNNTTTGITHLYPPQSYISNNYFAKQSYKYSNTHVVEALQDRILDAEYDNKKYSCYFDIIKNDGVVFHYVSEDLQSHGSESPWWRMGENPASENIDIRTDQSGTADNYIAGDNIYNWWIQCDDFTEADGNNDDDGDQPAHRKNTELLVVPILNFGDEEGICYAFDVDIYIDLILKCSRRVETSTPIRYMKFYNRNDGTGHIDAIGYALTGAVNIYSIGDNWQTLYPFRWGLSHENSVDGVDNLYQEYFYLDKPIKSPYP